MKEHLEEKKNGKKSLESASVAEETSDDSEVGVDLLSISSGNNVLLESWVLDSSGNYEDEDKSLLLLASLPTFFNHLVTTLMYGKDTIVLEEVTGALLSHIKMKQDGDGSQADGFIVRSESSNRGRSRSRGWNSNRNRSQSKSRAKKDVEYFIVTRKVTTRSSIKS